MKLVIFNVTHHYQNLTEMYMVSPSGLEGYLCNVYYKFSCHLPLKTPHPRYRCLTKCLKFSSFSHNQMSRSLPTFHQRKHTCPISKVLHSVQNTKTIDSPEKNNPKTTSLNSTVSYPKKYIKH